MGGRSSIAGNRAAGSHTSGTHTSGTLTPETRVGPIPEARNSDATGAAALGEADAALLLELCAALLAAGLPLPRILDELAEQVPGCAPLRRVVRSLELSMSWERAWAGQPPVLRRVGDALAFTHLTGAPSAAVLRSSAALERRSELRRAERRAAELGVRLVVPLGLCALPAFICLGIVPVVISLLPQLG
ncbi:type II secretion system F family protein [Arthrobacter ginkgonis]|uniref:type II secretion system F family protein n=1 Tax=Arthrobacter ginkgonis TaxID=1630594 RepID=UPI0031E5FE31